MSKTDQWFESISLQERVTVKVPSSMLGWRSAFVLAGILAAAGVLIVWAALPRASPGRTQAPQPLVDFRPWS